MKRVLGCLAVASTLCSATLEASPLEDWNRFEKQVRNQAFPRDTLVARFPAVYSAVYEAVNTPVSAAVNAAVSTAAKGHAAVSSDSGLQWTFPVAGYTLRDLGKGGFRPGIRYGGSTRKGYDFFDGNLHGGHPAYDIFIRDRDQNGTDDRTGLTVEVLAPEDMILLSREDSWNPGSELRGGKYAWALIPRAHMLVYFAHLDTIFASPGDRVPAGRPIGTIGRTGKNAWARRSPTHLHLMVLRVKGDSLPPVDYFPYFRK